MCIFDVVDTNDTETKGEFEVEIVAVVVGLLLGNDDSVGVPCGLCDNTGVFEPEML